MNQNSDEYMKYYNEYESIFNKIEELHSSCEEYTGCGNGENECIMDFHRLHFEMSRCLQETMHMTCRRIKQCECYLEIALSEEIIEEVISVDKELLKVTGCIIGKALKGQQSVDKIEIYYYHLSREYLKCCEEILSLTCRFGEFIEKELKELFKINS